MSRTPLSPVGKRTRIMSDTDESDDDDPESNLLCFKKEFNIQELYLKKINQGNASSGQIANNMDEDSDSITTSENETVNDDWPNNNEDEEDGDEFDEEDEGDDEDSDIYDDDDDNDDEDEEEEEEEDCDMNHEDEDDNADDVSEPDNESDGSGGSVVSYHDEVLVARGDGLGVDQFGNVEGMEAFVLADSDVDDDDFEYGIDDCNPEEYLKYDPTPETQYPRPNWVTLSELRRRKSGMLPRRSMYWFEKNANDSLYMIQRLMVTKHLNEHTGSVNCLGFSTNGRLLCSGSDDLSVCIWDWQTNQLTKKFNTSHTDNVFHSQFCNSDRSIITSSRDGSVRLIDVETGLSQELIVQSGEIGKIAFITPQTLVTCGTNACVNFMDLRIRKPEKLFIVRSPRNNTSCALHTIDSHPLDRHKIAIGGDCPYVFLYDLRRIACNPNEIGPIYCLDNNFEHTNNLVTSTVFNSVGDKLLISYNDDDLYVCRTDSWKFEHRYKGHRNEKTIKGCAWFGDNYVLSGSDDGHLYGWDLDSEHIVCFQKGNSKGAVNCLSVHPSLPILASSGLDQDVKVWEPHSSDWPQTMKNIKPVICTNTMRRTRDRLRRERVRAEQDNFDVETDESEPYL